MNSLQYLILKNRARANEIVGLPSGELFVHRNVAHVVEQAIPLCQTSTVQDAWQRSQSLPALSGLLESQ